MDLSVEEGLARVLARYHVVEAETVAVEAAIGRVLAEAYAARWQLPSAPLSIMDGYAVRSTDLRGEAAPVSLALMDESAAGHPSGALAPGSCIRIATGAVVPEGADAVVPQEDAMRHDDGAGDHTGPRVEFTTVAVEQVAPGRWIRPAGSDVAEGEALLDAGQLVGPGEASLLAAAGHHRIAVRRRPRVAILGSGDELVAIGQTPGRGQLVATNAMMLAAQIREAGGEPMHLGVVADEAEALRAAVEHARDHADLLISSGGISVGDHDLILPVLRELDFDLDFRRLRLRPGRPTTHGRLPPRGEEAQALPVLALPGNPASTYVAFELLARPLIRAMLGLPHRHWHRARRPVELAAPAEGDMKREHYVRAAIDDDGRAWPLSKQLSGALRSLAAFDVLLRVPEGRRSVAAGETLEAIFI